MTSPRQLHALSSSTTSPRARLAALLAPEMLGALEALVAEQVNARLAAAGANEAPLVRSDRTGIANRKVLEHVRAGTLPGVRIDGRVYIRRADLDAWIVQHAITRPAQPSTTAGSAANDTDDTALEARIERALSEPPRSRRAPSRRRRA